MQIAGYTLLENHEDYNEFVEDLEDYYGRSFHEFNLIEPKHYPVLIKDSVDGGTLMEVFSIQDFDTNDLKELYNKLHEIFGKES